MKKALYLILGLTLSVLAFSVLTACGSKKTESVSYQKISEVDDSRETLYFKEGSDEMTKQVSVYTVTYQGMEISGKEEAQNLFENDVYSAYKDLDGVDLSFDYTDSEVTMTMVLDYAEVNLSKLADADENPELKKADYLSVEQTSKSLEENGYTKVKGDNFQELQNN
ncbi:DUF1307 domain-containing protein [Streptococcus chenjunshii]|uniref:DUF1307 domain-containing protein n=1 Tax=Streptococcus chenjunshii TaxID=2173853 RepID=A0A372KIU7_9STRE|nr:DUF1307 domain-containing protein [Streptococcus chenjunshii]AXQ78423.1 DUF1307 domain-containing protein [Streptococcus chenjunshii]RFU49999.1 DUF1307 domain-containing protein [Streptococcus chenjunshii]RFU52199.1 DUF1307 domain-containing protein [Streptococcus chenjunshii]